MSGLDDARALLKEISSSSPPPFALICRGSDVEVMVGEVEEVGSIADIPLPPPGEGTGGERGDVLAFVPYRQLSEKGYDCIDDGTPLTVLRIRAQGRLSVAEVVEAVPDTDFSTEHVGFETDDEDYVRTVRKVLTEEIGNGSGANFVIRRDYTARILGYTPAAGLALFRRLLINESGTHWTFIAHLGERTLVGATPERHVVLRDGHAVMNPISGTYRYPSTGPRLEGVLGFLQDEKETEELYMVLDEELKMMSRVCDTAPRVTGPRLREMAKLAHTEYFIEGPTSADPREVLLSTVFAPTVTGSPLENACRVIARYERRGRGYYSGIAALFGRDAGGKPTLDSSILIRTADIDARGELRLGVGATLVRHSDPDLEAAETAAKAAGILSALTRPSESRLGLHPRVERALSLRNERVARFWRAGGGAAPADGPRVLVVDAEDEFTWMMEHMLGASGASVDVRPYDAVPDTSAYSLVVMGPGPGDPRLCEDPKNARLEALLRGLLRGGPPFIAVCLSHQVLSRVLGLPLERKEVPHQGTQRTIDYFGEQVRVGFYNSFTALCDQDLLATPWGGVRVCRDPGTAEVYALSGPRFRSAQFHAESVLSTDGESVLRRMLTDLLPVAATRTQQPEPAKRR